MDTNRLIYMGIFVQNTYLHHNLLKKTGRYMSGGSSMSGSRARNELSRMKTLRILYFICAFCLARLRACSGLSS